MWRCAIHDPSIHLSIFTSILLSIFTSLHLSIFTSIHLSIYLLCDYVGAHRINVCNIWFAIYIHLPSIYPRYVSINLPYIRILCPDACPMVLEYWHLHNIWPPKIWPSDVAANMTQKTMGHASGHGIRITTRYNPMSFIILSSCNPNKSPCLLIQPVNILC